jgi:hypothetical protein
LKNKEINKRIKYWGKKTIKIIRTKLNTKIKLNKVFNDEIEKKSKTQKASKAKSTIIKRMRVKIDRNTN